MEGQVRQGAEAHPGVHVPIEGAEAQVVCLVVAGEAGGEAGGEVEGPQERGLDHSGAAGPRRPSRPR